MKAASTQPARPKPKVCYVRCMPHKSFSSPFIKVCLTIFCTSTSLVKLSREVVKQHLWIYFSCKTPPWRLSRRNTLVQFGACKFQFSSFMNTLPPSGTRQTPSQNNVHFMYSIRYRTVWGLENACQGPTGSTLPALGWTAKTHLPLPGQSKYTETPLLSPVNSYVPSGPVWILHGWKLIHSDTFGRNSVNLVLPTEFWWRHGSIFRHGRASANWDSLQKSKAHLKNFRDRNGIRMIELCTSRRHTQKQQKKKTCRHWSTTKWKAECSSLWPSV